MTNSVSEFKISVPDSAIESLKAKLEITTFPDEVSFSDDWSYGSAFSDVKRLSRYWKDGFDWRVQEAKLNKLPQFTTIVSIDGFGDIEMHFIHQRSQRKDSVPLLFCHGWPGSFIESEKIIPLLTNGSSDSPTFHVVAPSLPNFGFSQGISKAGFGPSQYAEAVHKVMINLGYKEYVTQGGDWGTRITRTVGLRYPDHCKASHLNYIPIGPPSFRKNPLLFIQHLLTPYTEQEKAGIARTDWFKTQGSGYYTEQATKPATLGFGLADSPVALLAWIYEKLHDWTDNYPWTDDEVLTWVSIYQFSRAGPEASLRIYYETEHSGELEIRRAYEYNPRIKLGLSYFPKDLFVVPKIFGRALGPVVFEKVHESGGHFAAHEKPNELVADLRTMFGKGGGAHDIFRGLAGKY